MMQPEGQFHNEHGQVVPVVAFYSVSGGVGKSTLARKFAELVTLAPGLNDRRPNVLLIDLDVGSNGLTIRIDTRLEKIRKPRLNIRTVHEIMMTRNAIQADASDVTNAIELAGGTLKDTDRGSLYLVPASPIGATNVFDTLETMDKQEVLTILRNMISDLIRKFDILCVVIDCAPSANKYTAAAATLADVPLLIGRNEETTYQQMETLPQAFQREYFSQFQPLKQKNIINAVAAKEVLDKRLRQYPIFASIPLTTDVILKAEGLDLTESMRMLLFENYIVGIIEQLFLDKKHLIPPLAKVVGQEWIDILDRLTRIVQAPKMKQLRLIGFLRWVGIALLIIGVALIGINQIGLHRFGLNQGHENSLALLTNLGSIGTLIGGVMIVVGWFAWSERQSKLVTAQKLIVDGPEMILRKLKKEGATYRKTLDDMKKLADTIPERGVMA